jgi:hypothetical protein
VLKADALGHFTMDGSQGQKLAGSSYCGPVFWEGPAGPTLFTWPSNGKISGYKIANGRAETPPAYSGSVAAGGLGGGLTISSNGANGGILWGYYNGGLRAFDAMDLSKELWNSSTNKMRDDPGTWTKFGAPVVANGKVYVPTFSDQLVVYGLLP